MNLNFLLSLLSNQLKKVEERRNNMLMGWKIGLWNSFTYYLLLVVMLLLSLKKITPL